jgi:hypothetical protein
VAIYHINPLSFCSQNYKYIIYVQNSVNSLHVLVNLPLLCKFYISVSFGPKWHRTKVLYSLKSKKKSHRIFSKKIYNFSVLIVPSVVMLWANGDQILSLRNFFFCFRFFLRALMYVLKRQQTINQKITHENNKMENSCVIFLFCFSFVVDFRHFFNLFFHCRKFSRALKTCKRSSSKKKISF